jgi:hypothetical protein
MKIGGSNGGGADFAMLSIDADAVLLTVVMDAIPLDPTSV